MATSDSTHRGGSWSGYCMPVVQLHSAVASIQVARQDPTSSGAYFRTTVPDEVRCCIRECCLLLVVLTTCGAMMGVPGAAVYHYGDSATTFDDCIIRNNIGTNSGGAMESGTNTAPVFRNTHFISNHAVGQGGVSRTSGKSTPRFENCYFFNNTSPRGGVASNGGLSSIQYTGCTFKSNVGLLLGGAIECQGEASVLIDGCVFECVSRPMARVRMWPAPRLLTLCDGMTGTMKVSAAEGFIWTARSHGLCAIRCSRATVL